MTFRKWLLLVFLTLFPFLVYGQDERNSLRDMYWGLRTGLWHPLSKNHNLTNTNTLGVNLELKSNIDAFGFNFYLIFDGKLKNPVQYENKSIDTYFGSHITLDYSRQFFRLSRCGFGTIAELGYGTIDYTDSSQDKKLKENRSLVFSPGIYVRYLMGKKASLQLRLQYCMANYNIKRYTGSDFKGNYLMVSFIIGAK